MPSMKAIKRRRLTVKNIQQITKAMNLVATSKLQRARSSLRDVRKPALAAFDITYNTIRGEDTIGNTFLTAREVKKTAYVLLTSNRGLCGGYNSSICKELARHAKENGKNYVIVPVGTKGRDYFRRRGSELADFPAPSETVNFGEAARLADMLVSMYENHEIDEVFVVYTKFITVLNLEPVIKPVLPLDPDYLKRVLSVGSEGFEDLGLFGHDVFEPAEGFREVDYEPGLGDVLDNVIPWYVRMYMYAVMASSALCEQAARMTSMDSATSNAGDIIEKLTLMFNRQRQSIITQEITEIVSGANALQ